MTEVTVPAIPLTDAIAVLTGDAFDRVRAAAFAIRDAESAVIDARRRLSALESSIQAQTDRHSNLDRHVRQLDEALTAKRQELAAAESQLTIVQQTRSSEESRLQTIREQM